MQRGNRHLEPLGSRVTRPTVSPGFLLLAPGRQFAHHKRMTTLEKTNLRKQLRAQRRALSDAAQKVASRDLDRRLRKLTPARRAGHIAFYLPNDGEISPLLTLRRMARQQHACYLPCLAGKALIFRRFHPGQKLRRNRFNIPEPPQRRGNARPAHKLDVIFLPLVGFDTQGNRLGMGGGFYDRTLSHLPRQKTRRPLLVGLAHDFQQVERLPVQSWDIPLDVIATDRRLYWLSR